MKGHVHSIHVAPRPVAPTQPVREVRAVPGRGLEGDRYFLRTGTFARKEFTPAHELTLIEHEALEALARECSIVLAAGDARRNVVTRGISLNPLVGKTFRIGEVTACGIRLCEPCGHLQNLTPEGTRAGLVHRGGLRAQILTEGVLRVGDVVCDVHGRVESPVLAGELMECAEP